MYPNGIEIVADTVYEALTGLKFFPGLRPEDGIRHAVQVKGFETEELLHAHALIESITVEPILAGAGGSAGGKQLLIGALLVAVSFIIPGAGAFATALSKGLLYAGISTAIGGAIQLLMPAAKPPEAANSGTGSLFFSSTHNTVQIGTPIPLIIGRFKFYGHYLSFNINSKDFSPV